MRGKLVKDVGRQVNSSPAVQAALSNERVTRERVEAIETWAKGCTEAVLAIQALQERSLGGRLRWLLLGR